MTAEEKTEGRKQELWVAIYCRKIELGYTSYDATYAANEAVSAFEETFI